MVFYHKGLNRSKSEGTGNASSLLCRQPTKNMRSRPSENLEQITVELFLRSVLKGVKHR